MNSLVTLLLGSVLLVEGQNDPLVLRFGFHNMLSGQHQYQDVFEACLDHNLPVQVVEMEWREDVYPEIYYWGRSDSIVIAAHNASIGSQVPIELHCRFDLEICAPRWAPVLYHWRMYDFRNYDLLLEYVSVLVDRYKPNGVLAQQLGWNDGWGISYYELFGETDRCWCSAVPGDYPPPGPDLAPDEMNIDALASFYAQLRQTIRTELASGELPFSTLSIPFMENEQTGAHFYIPLDTEAEYCRFVTIFLDALEDLNVDPPDALDWHIFPLWNDPLYPGQWSPESGWGSKSLHARSYLIASLLGNSGCPIRSMEGCTTPYWGCIEPATLIDKSERSHISFQLSSIAEASVNGATDILVFDSTIDDNVSADMDDKAFMYEEWWNGIDTDGQDSLLLAYARQSELLTGTYCTGLEELPAGPGSPPSNTLILHRFVDPDNGLAVWQMRAKIDSPTEDPVFLDVSTDHVRFYHMLDTPSVIDCPQHVLRIPAGQDWEICWIEEIPNTINAPLSASTPQVSRFRISNTVSQELVIEVTSSGPGSVEAQVFDISGRLVASGILEMACSGTSQVSLDVSGLASGKYFVRLPEYSEEAIGFVLLR